MNGLMTTDEVCEAFLRAGEEVGNSVGIPKFIYWGSFMALLTAGNSIADEACIPREVFWARIDESLQADRDGHIHTEPGASLADMQTDEPSCSTCGFIPLKSAIARHYCSCYAPSGVTT